MLLSGMPPMRSSSDKMHWLMVSLSRDMMVYIIFLQPAQTADRQPQTISKPHVTMQLVVTQFS
jgi:hypothetical protein